MGLFKGLNDADAGGSRHPKLSDGSFEATIELTEVEKTRKTGDTLFVEYTITKSSNPARDPVGARRKWSQQLSADTALGNIKGFLYAVMGRDPKNADDKTACEGIDKQAEDIMEKAVKENTFKGDPIAIDVVTVQTQPKTGAPNGFPYARHTFRPAA